MAVDKTAVCLYLSDDTNQQIEQLASDMNTSKSGAVSFAVGRLFDEKDAVDLPLRIKKDVELITRYIISSITLPMP